MEDVGGLQLAFGTLFESLGLLDGSTISPK